MAQVTRRMPALRSSCERLAPLLRSYAASADAGVVRELKTDKDFSDVLSHLKESSGAAIVDYSAAWCGPCKLIAPVYSELAAKYPTVQFLKVDIDNQDIRETVAANSISSVPTFVAYRGGSAVSAFSGADRAQLLRMARELTGQSTGGDPV